MKKNVLLFIAVFSLISIPAVAQEVTYDVDFVRKKIQAGKKEVIEKNMVLSVQEREVFWPLYLEYQGEMKKVSDRLLKVIEAYVEAYETMTDKQAKILLDDYYDVEMKRLKLKKSYVKKFRRKLPSKTVTRYFQLENKIESIMKVELAASIPLVY
ncbi:MAG TPA: hypothetical protein DCO77_12455 [Nitrospiraceae bacterium]|nr:hypothetical protein [Nitrospiraceae bacterium]